MPLSEVLNLTVRQFWFLGERIEVYSAEDMLDAFTFSSYPHLKKEDGRKVLAHYRGIIERDKEVVGETRIMDRKGLDRLKSLMRSNASKRKT